MVGEEGGGILRWKEYRMCVCVCDSGASVPCVRSPIVSLYKPNETNPKNTRTKTICHIILFEFLCQSHVALKIKIF